MIALGNSVTSIYAGFIVFGTLGVLAEVSSMTIFKSVSHNLICFRITESLLKM